MTDASCERMSVLNWSTVARYFIPREQCCVSYASKVLVEICYSVHFLVPLQTNVFTRDGWASIAGKLLQRAATVIDHASLTLFVAYKGYLYLYNYLYLTTYTYKGNLYERSFAMH